MPLTRSELEDAALSLFASFSVPRPDTNVWVSDGDKLVEVDFAWRELGLIVEVDGSRYHGTPAQVAATILAAIRGPRDL